MKKLQLSFLLIAGFLISQSQTIDVKWGNETKVPVAEKLTSVFEGPENSIYISRVNEREGAGGGIVKSTHYIEKYDNACNLKFAKEIELPKFNKEQVKHKATVFVGKKLYALAKCMNEDEKTNYLLATEINQTTGESAPLKSIVDLKHNGDYNDFEFRSSINNEKLLVYCKEVVEKEASAKFDLWVLNENLVPEAKASLTFPYPDDKLRIANYSLDKSGTIFFLCSIKSDINKYSLFAYSVAKKELTEIKLDLNSRICSEITMRHNEKNNSVFICGLYKDNIESPVKGTFFFEIDRSTLKTVRSNYGEVSAQLMDSFKTEREERKDKEPMAFHIGYVFFTEDGGNIIIAEQNHMRIKYASSGTGSTSTHYTYIDRSLLVLKADKTGKTEWGSIVPKLQVSFPHTALFSGYYAAHYNNAVYIIFNDNPENLSKTDNKDVEDYKLGKKGCVTLATIDKNGKVKRTISMQEAERLSTVLAPGSTIKKSDSEFILFSGWNKNMRFGRMLIK
jgi:hypothetical protein